MEKKILNVVLGGVIDNKGEILLLNRRKFPYAGYWGLPGGAVEFGEHLEEAVEREIKEETNIEVKFISLKGLVHEILYQEKSGEKLQHFQLWICELEPSHFKTKESREGKLKWFPVRSLGSDKEKIVPSDFLMIKKFFVKKAPTIKVYKVKMLKTGKNYRIGETDL